MESFFKSVQHRAAVALLAATCSASIVLGWLLNQTISRSDGSEVLPWLNFWQPNGYAAGAITQNILLMLLATVGAAVCAVRIIGLIQGAVRESEDESAEEIDAAGQQLVRQILSAAELLRSQTVKSKDFSTALNTGHADLQAAQLDPKKVDNAVRFLLAANTEMQQANAYYEKKLIEAREQIDALRTSLTETQEVAMRDSLTNVFTRRHFDQTLAKHVADTKNARSPLSLIIADLDHFKKINDSFGHPVGDEVLKNFSALLVANTKGRDCVARYGGEEFAIILPNTSLHDAAHVAAQIRTQLSTKRWATKAGASLGMVTASFGAAELEPGETSVNLIERADAKLYQAKAAGRNRVMK